MGEGIDDGTSVRRRLCVCVDMQGYSLRTGESAQHAAQRVLCEALDKAAAHYGLDRSTWWRQPSGDGECAVLTDPDAEPIMVGRFPAAVSDALWELAPRAGYRLRLGLHHGIAAKADMGFSGDGVVEVARITDSQVVRRFLAAAPGANLVLALSHRVYVDTVRGGRTGIDPRHFHEVRVENKEYRGRAWLHLPGVDPSWGPPAPDTGPPDPTPDPTTTAGPRYRAGGDMSVVNVQGDWHGPIQFGRARD